MAPLANVPPHWKIVQTRRVATVRNGADYRPVEVPDGGYPVYGSGGEFRRSAKYLFDGESVLFGRKGTVDRPLLVSGRFWTVDTMFYTELQSTAEARFFYYVALTVPFAYYATNTAVPSMTQNDLSSHPIPLPPLDEQRAIANYLDRETAQIDTLIAEQQRLIELLDERRSAAFRQAFPASPATALRRFVSSQRPLTYGILQCGEPYPDGVPYVGPSDMETDGRSPRLADLRRTSPEIAAQYSRSVLRSGDVVVSIGPAYGKIALLSDELSGANLTQDTVRVDCNRSTLDPNFLVRLLQSPQVADFWDMQITGATFRRLNLGTLGLTPVPILPLDEQRRIVAELDEVTSKIDTLIAEAERFIELSKERRSALITAAVTGQIEIPGVA